VGVVTSLTRCIVGVAEQLSVAVGTSIKAAVIPLALLHCNVWFKVPDVVVIIGEVVSFTATVFVHSEVHPLVSVVFKVKVNDALQFCPAVTLAV
jgi:hypothetical protein